MYKKNLDNLSIKLLEYFKSLLNWFEWKTIKEVMYDNNIDHPQKLYDRLEKLIKGGFIDEDYNYIMGVDNAKIYLPFFWWAQCWNYWPEWFEDYPIEKIDIDEYDLEEIKVNNVKNYFITRAKWKSMEPKIFSWQNLLVKYYDNTSIKKWTFYLIKHNWKAKIKELEKKSWWINLVSLNEAYPDLFVSSKEDFIVIGEFIKTL